MWKLTFQKISWHALPKVLVVTEYFNKFLKLFVKPQQANPLNDSEVSSASEELSAFNTLLHILQHYESLHSFNSFLTYPGFNFIIFICNMSIDLDLLSMYMYFLVMNNEKWTSYVPACIVEGNEIRNNESAWNGLTL